MGTTLAFETQKPVLSFISSYYILKNEKPALFNCFQYIEHHTHHFLRFIHSFIFNQAQPLEPSLDFPKNKRQFKCWNSINNVIFANFFTPTLTPLYSSLDFTLIQPFIITICCFSVKYFTDIHTKHYIKFKQKNIS